MKKKQVEKEQNNEKQLPRQETTLGEDIFQLLLKIVLIILAVILVFTFMYGMARINDVSMKPAIKDGDLVMYYRLDKRFVSGDIAVFKKDGRTTTGAEEEKRQFDFVVSRAVMPLMDLIKIIRKNIKKEQKNALPNGLICLKGGELDKETMPMKNHVTISSLSDVFHEEFFETKKVVYVSL